MKRNHIVKHSLLTRFWSPIYGDAITTTSTKEFYKNEIGLLSATEMMIYDRQVVDLAADQLEIAVVGNISGSTRFGQRCTLYHYARRLPLPPLQQNQLRCRQGKVCTYATSKVLRNGEYEWRNQGGRRAGFYPHQAQRTPRKALARLHPTYSILNSTPKPPTPINQKEACTHQALLQERLRFYQS